MQKLFLPLALLLAGCSARGPTPPPPVPTPSPLAFHANVPPSLRTVLAAQYGSFPAHLQLPVAVRVATQAELQEVADIHGHQRIGGVYDQPNNTIWLSDIQRDARWTFAHEYGHAIWAHMSREEWDDWRAWWNAGGGKPVLRFWKPAKDANGNHGSYAEGWADAVAWTYGPIGGPVFGEPAPPALAAKVRSLTGEWLWPDYR